MASMHARFLRFGQSDYWGLATAVRYLVTAGWQLYVRRTDLSPWLGTPCLDALEPESAALPDFPMTAAQYVDIASRHPFPWARCLQRSLALCLWLNARGFRPALKIGVCKEGASLKAHAWVQVGSKIISDPAEIETRFAVLPAPSEETAERRRPAGSSPE